MKKCDKYQSLFIFRDEDELNAHLEVCEDCRQVHSDMHKLESLIQSSKSVHFKQKTSLKLNKIVAAIGLFVFVSVFTGNVIAFNSIEIHPKHQEVIELINNSIFNQMKLPTDEYGIMNPHEEVYND